MALERRYYCPPCTDEKTEAQGVKGICLRPHAGEEGALTPQGPAASAHPGCLLQPEGVDVAGLCLDSRPLPSHDSNQNALSGLPPAALQKGYSPPPLLRAPPASDLQPPCLNPCWCVWLWFLPDCASRPGSAPHLVVEPQSVGVWLSFPWVPQKLQHPMKGSKNIYRMTGQIACMLQEMQLLCSSSSRQL